MDVKTQEILVSQVSSLEEKVAWQLLAGEHCTYGGIRFEASCLLCWNGGSLDNFDTLSLSDHALAYNRSFDFARAKTYFDDFDSSYDVFPLLVTSKDFGRKEELFFKDYEDKYEILQIALVF